MKKTKFPQFIVLFLLVAQSVFAQYSKVDALVKTYPKSFSNPEQLAAKINRDFSSDDAKARAIFTWVATNTTYDLRAAKAGSGTIAYSFTDEADRLRKEQQFREKYAQKTLRSGKGICQDYSALFHTLCNLTGLQCIDIVGTSKSHPTHIGKLPKQNDHEWNAVKIDGRWKLIDVTWASGCVSTQTGKFVPEFNDAYYGTAPEVFFLNHFPDDERFLMIDKNDSDFAELRLYYGPYIKSDYEIAMPEKGVLSAKSGVIAFKIIDFPEHSKIAYVFTSEGKVYDASPRRNGQLSEFEVTLNGRSRGFLTIYVDRSAVATYKIER